MKAPFIKAFIIEDTPQEKNFTQSGFASALVPCEDSVGHELVKISVGRVRNRSGLRATSAIGYITSNCPSPWYAYHKWVRPKTLTNWNFLGRGHQTLPCGNFK